MTPYKFALEHGDNSFEAITLKFASALRPKDFEVKWFKNVEVPSDFIPVGNIRWVSSFLGYTPKPDHYPDFLQPFLNRNIRLVDDWIVKKDLPCFIKPADKPKRYKARILKSKRNYVRRKGPHWVSSLTSFENEWRIYVTAGEISHVGWYYPEHKNDIPCPDEYLEQIQNVIPSGWCGAIDIGTTNRGLTLVEAGEPYAMGWYGSSNEGYIYANWLGVGWDYLKTLNDRNSLLLS